MLFYNNNALSFFYYFCVVLLILMLYVAFGSVSYPNHVRMTKLRDGWLAIMIAAEKGDGEIIDKEQWTSGLLDDRSFPTLPGSDVRSSE